ncbi:MAG: ankyrin repeat domain-containing protein [Sphingobacteriaceae bacterium]|nr:ankyrin repeat domain-containing protein [Sphingobacteriaceae bacterium]
MDYSNKIITDIELHSVGGLEECFKNGISPNDYFEGQPLIYELISEYTRTPRFKNCVKVFIDYGLDLDDKALLAVLSDDVVLLKSILQQHPETVTKTYTLKCAYTPLYKVTLLHICAEFNHTSCAEMLVSQGADINATAGVDEYGFGGQTPIFHTVNQNSNNSADMLNYLISQSASLELMVKGLIWGKGYTWESLIPAVNPISYAMMGLFPQMHRNEITVSETVSQLLKAAFGIDYLQANIPNAYLR